MTKNKTVKKTVRKSTTSHSTKVAQKSNAKAKAKTVPQELQEGYYNKETLKNVYAIGSKFLKASEKFEKSTVAQTVELINLSNSMINEAFKNHLELNKIKLKRALYKFTQYDVSTEVKQFEMALSRIVDKAFELFENPKFSVSEKTAQLLDEKGKVISIKEIQNRKKASGKVTPRPNADKKNKTQVLSDIKKAITLLKGASGDMLKNIEPNEISGLITKLLAVNSSQVIEAKEGSGNMKKIGEADLPKDLFTNPKANKKSPTLTRHQA